MERPYASTGGAIISDDGLYRYSLRRQWRALPGSIACWIMLNPSTADAEQDDPTIRRCIAFSKAWGYGALCVVNLFAYRATSPAAMKADPDPVGPDNDGWILDEAQHSDLVIAAWGTNGAHDGRDTAVLELLRNANVPVHCLNLSKHGLPSHPLYQPGHLWPMLWRNV